MCTNKQNHYVAGTNNPSDFIANSNNQPAFSSWDLAVKVTVSIKVFYISLQFLTLFSKLWTKKHRNQARQHHCSFAVLKGSTLCSANEFPKQGNYLHINIWIAYKYSFQWHGSTTPVLTLVFYQLINGWVKSCVQYAKVYHMCFKLSIWKWTQYKKHLTSIYFRYYQEFLQAVLQLARQAVHKVV